MQRRFLPKAIPGTSLSVPASRRALPGALRALCLGLALAAVGITATGAPAAGGMVTVAPKAADAVLRALEAPVRVVPLVPGAEDQSRHLFSLWVSGSVELDQAEVRSSTRFPGRVLYRQATSPTPSRRLGERLVFRRTPSGVTVTLDPQALRVDAGEPSADVRCRVGGGQFLFRKNVEARHDGPVDRVKLVDEVRGFLRENRFVRESDADRQGPAEVVLRRVNQEGADGGAPEDFVVQADVVIGRAFEGKPVVNSKAVLGVSPSTGEIVKFGLFDWVPARPEKARVVLGRTGFDAASELLNRMEAKVRERRGAFVRAEVVRAEAAWVQTADALVPVMVFEVEAEYAYPDGSTVRQPGLEILSLAGGDDVVDGEPGRDGENPLPH
ncbi:MAG: hypothetical protein KA419_03285 [Acidobacteria bacterium]|nr:hypothetical protein [Acidobacteriota bacterium]